MSKVTSKLQVTIPKAVAAKYGIRPGDEVDWVAAADCIRVVPRRAGPRLPLDRAERLRLFDEATARQRRRETENPRTWSSTERGWTREDLYTRGSSR
jgi:AbrB family looped-hinge helix DNA binding protein